jgi:hypothetical protein
LPHLTLRGGAEDDRMFTRLTRWIRRAMNPLRIQRVTLEIESAMKALIAPRVREPFTVIHYGANDIHPSHLVYWICVQSDAEKRRLEDDVGLMQELRGLLAQHDYPEEGRRGVHIGYESQETVDRESGGNWWHHFK